MTLAPELAGSLELLRLLGSKGIISSAGHTSSSFQEILQAADAGLSHLTHIANAMTGLHHREVGAVGAGMLDQRLFCEIIADGVHLSEEMLQLLRQTTGISWRDAIRVTSGNAAARLGIADQKGSLMPGSDADIVLLDDAADVKFTFCRGKLSYVQNKD